MKILHRHSKRILFCAALFALMSHCPVHAQGTYYSYVSTLDGVIYKVNLNDCTSDSVTDLHRSVYDIALSPGGKLYLILTPSGLSITDSIMAFDLNTLTLTMVGAFAQQDGDANALACDSVGNLLTITTISPGYQLKQLCYIDTLDASLIPIGPVDSFTRGDLTYYGGDIYYNDVSGFLHQVTLAPVHDRIVGQTGCGADVYGLSANLVDTLYCHPSIFAYSDHNICRVSELTGATTPWCQAIIPAYHSGISGAAAPPTPLCAAKNVYALPTAFSPNGDGKNDLFYPILAAAASLVDFRIYNRWGQLVHDSVQPWDGTFNAAPQPGGVYQCYFTIIINDNGHQQITLNKEGTFTLFR